MRSFAEKLNKAKENKKGFTLVEIIVVLVIIGILASLMSVSYTHLTLPTIA